MTRLHGQKRRASVDVRHEVGQLRACHERREDFAVPAEHRIGGQGEHAERDRGAKADDGALGSVELSRASDDDVFDLLRIRDDDDGGRSDHDLADRAERARRIVEEVAAGAGRLECFADRREVARHRQRSMRDAG